MRLWSVVWVCECRVALRSTSDRLVMARGNRVSYSLRPWACKVVTTIRLLLTHPDRNTQNERRATQSNTRQRTQGKQNQRSRNNTSKPKTNTADPEHYSKPPTTENRNLRTNRKPLPSKPPPKAYLNHTVQANQTCQGPPWILPVTPVSTGRVQATSKHLTASLRVECVPGTHSAA